MLYNVYRIPFEGFYKSLCDEVDEDVFGFAENINNNFEALFKDFLESKKKETDEEVKDLGEEDYGDFLSHYLEKRDIDNKDPKNAKYNNILIVIGDIVMSCKLIPFKDIQIAYAINCEELDSVADKVLKFESIDDLEKAFEITKKDNEYISQLILKILDKATPDQEYFIEGIVDRFKSKIPNLENHDKYKNRELNCTTYKLLDSMVTKFNSYSNMLKKNWKIEDLVKESSLNTCEGKDDEEKLVKIVVLKLLHNCSEAVKTDGEINRGKVDIPVFNNICLQLLSRANENRAWEGGGNESWKKNEIMSKYHNEIAALVKQSRNDLIKHFEEHYNQRLNHFKEFLEKTSKTEKGFCIATVITASASVITSGLKLIELLGGSKILESVLGRFTNLGLKISSGFGVMTSALAVFTLVKVLVDCYKSNLQLEDLLETKNKINLLQTGNAEINNAMNGTKQDKEEIEIK